MRNLNRFACVVAGALLTVPVSASPAGMTARALPPCSSVSGPRTTRSTTQFCAMQSQQIGCRDDVSWRDPPGQAAKNEVKDQGPSIVKLRDHQQMVVRGRETTFISEADPEMKRLNPARGCRRITNSVWQRTSSRKSPTCGALGPLTSSTKRQNANGPDELVLEQRTEIEFSHGFGFGKRITAIDSVVREGNNRIIKGRIQLLE